MAKKIYIVTSPSGAGKTSLVSAVIERTPNLAVGISHTTRKPREGEREGVHYYFTDKDGFAYMEGDMFAKTDYHGNKYGTTKGELLRIQDNGDDCILIMDHVGTLQTKEVYPDATTIFILPENKRVLEQRLRDRGDMSEADIEHRLSSYYEEILNHHKYDYVLLNNDFEEAVNNLKGIIDG